MFLSNTNEFSGFFYTSSRGHPKNKYLSLISRALVWAHLVGFFLPLRVSRTPPHWPYFPNTRFPTPCRFTSLISQHRIKVTFDVTKNFNVMQFLFYLRNGMQLTIHFNIYAFEFYVWWRGGWIEVSRKLTSPISRPTHSKFFSRINTRGINFLRSRQTILAPPIMVDWPR